MSVAALLKQSLAAHDRAKQLRRQARKDQARESLTQARALREQAHALDPDHTDAAWADEADRTPTGRNTHQELTAFYAQMLGD